MNPSFVFYVLMQFFLKTGISMALGLYIFRKKQNQFVLHL